ncbi:MAG: aminopeptidase P family protein [Immundisolibacterales bacterium]|nr:aminopeptidase P family protein [Immundisolibacterales bacterium]
MRAKGTRARLAGLRDAMREHGVAAYIVPSSDPHQSEYVPARWARREWMSGFTGSAGDLVVGLAGGGLWTDGRYHLQARQQLRGSGLKLFPVGEKDVPTIERHLAKTLPRESAVGVDPAVIGMRRARRIARALASDGVALKPIEENLVDAVRGPVPGRRSRARVVPLATQFAGETSASKLRRVRRAMRERGADALVVTTLDAIAWLFNVRGSDVAYNPVVIAYAVVTADEAVLHVDRAKIDAAAEAHLRRTARIEPYAAIRRTLRGLGRRKAVVWIDPDSTSLMCGRLLDGARPVFAPSPIARMKARKNDVELAGIRAAHRRDGAAMVRFLHWLSRAVPAGGVTEMGAAAALEGLRSEGEHFQGLSFPTIAGYAGHGAIIHYSVDEASDVPLRPEGLFLVDSGAHYLDGTTDITRTLLLGGRPTGPQRDCYTRVLKGHIAIATARFPAGTTGARLDTLARAALWQSGRDYAHGTGHGVGAYLNVHEGPQSISHRSTEVPLEPGNVQSNEPGYYEPGEFGIRIENLVEVVKDETVAPRDFLRFETLTLCPIEKRLIEPELLSADERGWLDAYHARVLETLGPDLDRDDRTWLERACVPLDAT